MSCYIYQLPSWVLDDLCRNMDTLSEWDWMQFGEWGAREGGSWCALDSNPGPAGRAGGEPRLA